MRATDHRRLAAGVGGLAMLAGAAAIAQQRHMKRIASDPQQELLSKPPRGRGLAIRAEDGTALHAEMFGPEEGTTIVLAHGWTETLTLWTYVTSELSARGFRVVAYDLRGHGQSEPAANGDYSLERFGQDLEAVLAAVVPDGQQAVIAGHSLGAMSIAAWAEHHDVNRRVGAAALLNTGLGDLIAESLLFPVPHIARALVRPIAVHGFLGSRAPLPRHSTPVSYRAVRYTAFGPAASPAQVAFFERMLVASTPDVRASVGLAMSTMDLHHAIANLTVPTIVLAGERDKLTPPSHAKRIAEALPDLVRLVVLPGTAHMAPLERADEVCSVLDELGARLRAHQALSTA